MKDNLLKKLAKFVFFRPGSVRRIGIGPLRGMVYRVDDITGMSPWYSGSEREHQNIFQKLVRSGDTVIDVGANWGVHSLYLSKLVGPSGLVLAVEPFPQVIEVLRWHLQANGCQNVIVIEKAASDEHGEASFAVGQSAYTGGLAAAIQGGPSHREIAVATEKLDKLVVDQKLDRIRLIKIDVEGAETKVLEGARELIERDHPYLVVDLHTPEQDVSIGRLLTGWNYKLSRLSGPPITRTDVGWPNMDGVWGTVLAAPAV